MKYYYQFYSVRDPEDSSGIFILIVVFFNQSRIIFVNAISMQIIFGFKAIKMNDSSRAFKQIKQLIDEIIFDRYKFK